MINKLFSLILCLGLFLTINAQNLTILKTIDSSQILPREPIKHHKKHIVKKILMVPIIGLTYSGFIIADVFFAPIIFTGSFMHGLIVGNSDKTFVNILGYVPFVLIAPATTLGLLFFPPVILGGAFVLSFSDIIFVNEIAKNKKTTPVIMNIPINNSNWLDKVWISGQNIGSKVHYGL